MPRGTLFPDLIPGSWSAASHDHLPRGGTGADIFTSIDNQGNAPTYSLTGQSDRGPFSVEVLSSRMTLCAVDRQLASREDMGPGQCCRKL